MQYLLASLRYLWQQLWPILKPDQELSWRTFLFLCLLSWVMALMTSDSAWVLDPALDRPQLSDTSPLFFQLSLARLVLFTLGWGQLCIAMAWLLVKSKFKIPFFDIVVYPAAWVVGALTSAYFFVMGQGDIRTAAVVGWPLVSAGYTLLPKVLTSTWQWKTPTPAVRQQFTILFLASATVSCWLQFQVLVQNWVTHYPVLLLGPVEESAFVIAVGDRPPIVKIAVEALDQTLQLRSLPEVRVWIGNAESYSPSVNARFQSKLVTARENPLEQLLEQAQGDDQLEQAQNDGQLEQAQNGDREIDSNLDSNTIPPSPTSTRSDGGVPERVSKEKGAEEQALEEQAPQQKWRLDVVPEPLDAEAMRLQLRSIPPDRPKGDSKKGDSKKEDSKKEDTVRRRDAYIEYPCNVYVFIPGNKPPEIAPEPVPEPAPETAPNRTRTDGSVPETGSPNRTTAENNEATAENIDAYRQTKVTCRNRPRIHVVGQS